PLPNMISIEQDDKVMAVINVITLKEEDYINNNFLVMSTRRGLVKKTSLEAYSRPRQNGINAININEGDELLDVKLTNGNNDIIIAARSGKACRFHESDVRAMGRTATGVRGIRLASDEDEVIGMVCIEDRETNLLVVSEKGYGKRSEVEDYRITKRGGKGVKAMKVTEKTGELAAIKNVTDLDELMIINKSGVTIRMAIAQLRVMGRATQGVRLIKLSENDEISSVAKIEGLEAIEEVLGEEGIEQIVENELPTDEQTDGGQIDTEEEGNEEKND
ncbi:MAG: DNA gyrase subunit A, partial [Bacteroidia bacterium]